MPCVFKWNYHPHDCLKKQVADCKKKCKELGRKYGGCFVIAELQWDCTLPNGAKTGGKLDAYHCCCKWKGHSSEEVERMRKRFKRRKKTLRKQWAKDAKLAWPKNEDGVNLDAHHINPLKYCGQNRPGNLVPLPRKVHIETHKRYQECYK